MSTDLEKLLVQLEVRQNRFEREMARARRTTQQRTRQIESDFKRMNTSATAQMVSLGRGVSAALGPLLGIGAGAFGAAGIMRGVRGAVSELSGLGKTARDTGIDVEELQGLMRGFARQTRISEDQAAQAFERFNRRVGEAVNGMGPLNATLERHGISVRRANGEMRSQAEMLREVADLMRRTTNEQERAAIAQAAFGDVGRQMAAALAEGSAGLDRMVQDAMDAGDVIDRDLIQRAELLDDRFDALTRRVGTFFKALAVGAVGGGVETPVDTLERMFGSLERARQALGDDLVGALTADLGVIDQYADSLDGVAESAGELRARSDGLIATLDDVAAALVEMNEQAAARDLLMITDDINDAVIAFRAGEISAEDMAAAVRDGGAAAFDTANAIRDLDTATLGRIMQAVNALTGALGAARAEAAGLNAEMGNQPRSSLSIRNAAITESGAARDAARAFIAEQERQRSLTTDQIALEREMDSLRRDAGREGVALTEAQIEAQARLNITRATELRGGGGASGGSSGGGGGGSARASDFDQAVDAIRDRTHALEAEAAALVLAAGSGREYGEAIAFAQQRARLLHAAQRSGMDITPELEAAVDRLAAAYARAGDSAASAADQMRAAQQHAQSGAQALSNLFTGIISGSGSARQALAGLISQIAQVQLTRALMSSASGPLGFLGRLLTPFHDGGWTGPGATGEPKGVVHGNEYVFSARATRALGVDQLDAMHRQARGYANGGFVGVSPGSVGLGPVGQKPIEIDLSVSVDDDGRLKVVAERAGAAAAAPVAVRIVDKAMKQSRADMGSTLRRLQDRGTGK